MKYDSTWDNLFNGSYGFNPIEANKMARQNGHSFPLEEHTFRFAETPIDKIKCVIIGMEPYASWFIDQKGVIIPQATGRSFEVKELEGKTWLHKFKQASLRNMAKCVMLCEKGEYVTAKEFRNAIENKSFIMANPSDWFENLSKQGVCFLNAALTVEKDKPGTGKDYWGGFGKAFVSTINQTNQNVTWFLFGKEAQNAFLPFLENQKVVCAPHPRMAEFSKFPYFNECKDIDWTGLKEIHNE